MSIIVAVRDEHHIVLGCDTLSTWGDCRITEDKVADLSKIIPTGDSFIGFTGWSLYRNILEDFLKRKKKRHDLSSRQGVFRFFLEFYRDLKEKYSYVNHGSEKEPFSDLDSTFLVAGPAGIFHVSSNMDIEEFTKYCAIGSGQEYAYGALHVLYGQKKSLRQVCKGAILAACEFDIYCQPPLRFVEIEADRTKGVKHHEGIKKAH